MQVLVQIGLVAVGSALGGLARWGVSVSAARYFGVVFPYGTFAVNILGSLFLGWFTTVLSERLLLSSTTWIRPDDLRLMIAVGFTGSFTTFSTFEYETNNLLREGSTFTALMYLFLSIFLGLLAVRLGIALARRF